MSLRKLAALIAAFGLMVGLIGSGVGAVFTDQVTGQENINVGTFSCGITDATPGAVFGDVDGLGYAHSVTYTAPTIMSSAAGSAPFSFTVKNTGSIPNELTVATSPVAAPFSVIGAPFAPVYLASGDTTTYATGVQWGALTNANLGQSGSETWTVSCGEQQLPDFKVGYYTVNNGGTQFDPGTFVRSTTPIASTAVVGGGTATQSVSGGALDLAITGGGPYADNGFYVPLGTLGSLTGYTVTGTGDQFGTNLYFDVDKNGEFFGWTSNSLSSIAPDTYGLGPTSSGGVLTVGNASTFAMTCNGLYGNYSLATLSSTGCAVEGVDASTPVAVWIGITSTGGALSTTITSAP